LEYELTDPGYSLRPVLDTLNVWGEGYWQAVAEAREDEAQAQVL
jgi:DNA-binding HxlR family transcriptional regulator